MSAEILYIAIYLLGVAVGAIFVIVAKGIEFEDFSWVQKSEDPFQDDLKSPLQQPFVTLLSSHLNFGMLKK